MNELPTTPVEARDLRKRHLIVLDDLVAKVLANTEDRNGRRVIKWIYVDQVLPDHKDRGTVRLDPGTEVPVVRVEDWQERIRGAHQPDGEGP